MCPAETVILRELFPRIHCVNFWREYITATTIEARTIESRHTCFANIPSEAFDYFLKIIDAYLTPLCTELNEVIHGELHPELAKLLNTLENPKKLIAAMHALEPLHHQLVTRNMNDPKNRPSSTQIDASKNYLALRAQLLSELPRYFQLLDKGIVACIIQFAQRQTEFWGNVRDRWAYLWDALRMEGETDAGAAETLRV